MEQRYFIQYSNSDILHYGVLGMKWGIRRYQNPDGTLTSKGKQRYQHLKNENIRKYGLNTKIKTSLPKGTEIKRITTKDELIDNRPKYVSYVDEDNDFYEETYYFLIKPENRDKAVQITYKLKKDIKIATPDEVTDYVLNKYKDVKFSDMKIASTGNAKSQKLLDIISDDMKNLKISELYKKENIPTVGYPVLKGKKIVDDLLELRAYESRDVFRQLMQKALFKDREEVYNHFKNKGYDAITDVEDYNPTDSGIVQPLIILNPKNTLEYISEKKIR